MKRFEVLAGWMEPELVIGVCDVVAARGKELVSFSYDVDWLRRFPGLIIDPDIAAVPGRQYPPEDKPCFGFLADAAPDRWGRKLMERRERLDAVAEKRPVRKLLENDYILGVQDNGRLGARCVQYLHDKRGQSSA